MATKRSLPVLCDHELMRSHVVDDGGSSNLAHLDSNYKKTKNKSILA